jgi:hypothetical protein
MWIVVVASLLLPTGAQAKGGGADDLLDVVVLPFAVLSARKPQADTKESIELELELVDNVRVQESEAVEQDLDALGEDAFEPGSLSRVLRRRGVEVLIAAPADLGRSVVVVFAADGKPRIVKDLPRGAPADQLTATTMAVLKPALARWAKQKPVPLPAGGKGRDRDTGVVDDDDVLVQADRVKKPARNDDDADDDGGRKPRVRDKDRDRSRGRTRGDDAGDDPGEVTRVREEASTRGRAALDTTDDDTLGQRERRSLTDIEEDDVPVGGAGPVKATHLIAMSGAFEGATWRYTLETDNGIAPKPVAAGFFPGGAVRFDLWPWEFAGIDAAATIASVPFVIPPVRDASGNVVLQVTPGNFSAVQVNVGGALRGRWMLRFAEDGPVRMVGLGGRLGYRYWSSSTETQLISGSQKLLTVVPGFTFHGLTIGPEVYLPVFVADRRFEFELKLDTVPLTFYGEAPDNPGGSSLAFGYHAELLARFDILSGVFVELAGKSTGATINFEGPGNRVTFVTNDAEPVRLEGGRALNFTAGFTVGLGFMY